MLKGKNDSKFYLSILFSVGIFFYFSSAKAGKTEYDIPCREQIFNDGFNDGLNDGSLNRSTVHLSRYTPDNKELNQSSSSLVFFHGGPGIKNDGQFDQFISQFTDKGFTVYVPEIIGSSYYKPQGMDANEYKRNYWTDIQAVVNHMEAESSGKKYAIAHSLGCHQLFHFMGHPQANFRFEKVSAVAGPWDVGANRLYALGGDWKNEFKAREMTILMSTIRSFVGMYANLEHNEKPMTTSYNPVVTRELNERFSVLYNIDQLPKTTAIHLVHAKDDKQVAFSLSLEMYEALRNRGHKVSGYFMSTGDHGFIKNPVDLKTADQSIKERMQVATNILNFFTVPELKSSVSFDDSFVETQDIYTERNIKSEHKEFLERIKNF